MSRQAVNGWFQANSQVVDRLIAANQAVARSAGEAGRALQSGVTGQAAEMLCQAAAADLLHLRALSDDARFNNHIPDSVVNVHWLAALKDWSEGAEVAERGTRTMDQALMSRGSAQMTRGSAKLDQATAALGRLL